MAMIEVLVFVHPSPLLAGGLSLIIVVTGSH